MIHIRGGEFAMGMADPRSRDHGGSEAMEDARPVHRVAVHSFWIDKTDVTNAEFARFVRATGYITVAEQIPDARQFPGATRDTLRAGAIVFTRPDHPVSLSDPYGWWSYVPGANWRHPSGPASSIAGHDADPVVQVAYEDAEAYARWAGKRLPTEAEWEFAARGGLEGKLYAWGDALNPGGRWMANIFEGRFPISDTREDGYSGVAPVAQFPPNGYGLYDMSGNVWQWVSDWYRPDYYAQLASRGPVARNPTGPSSSFDPSEPGVSKRVQRGGSFLCTDQYCTRYMVGARGRGEPSSATNHVGFRCVSEAD
jgi:formylglycine-generating enzyme required for sulfatase activity